MRLTAIGLAAATLLTSAAPALAAAPVAQEDARCVLIMNLLAQDPQQKGPASMALFYFLGRLDTRGDKLEALLVSERKALDSEAAFKTELERCGAIMSKRSADLNTMYQRLEAAQAKEAPPAAATPAAPAAATPAAPAKPPAK